MGAKRKNIFFVEYLALEAETGLKYEYYDGFLVAMAGSTPVHAQLGMTVGSILFGALRGKECIPYSSDARVAVEEANSYLYPDVTVVCGPLQTVEGQAIANPTLVVEVISEGSELYDRGEKFRLYRQIASLQQYVLVSQKSPRVETYHRNPDGSWTFTEAAGLEGNIYLAALDINMPLSEVYWKVDFGANPTA